MDAPGILRLLDEGFTRWQKLVGVDPTKSRFTLAEWDARDQMQDLQELRQLDPTGLSPFMLMKALVHEHIASEKVTALDLIKGLSIEQLDRIEALRDVYEFMERPEIDSIIQSFIDSVRRAVSQYGLVPKEEPEADDEPSDIEGWLGDYYRMAILRRDAIKALTKLEKHQFFHGKPGTNGRFVYTTKVMEIWNIPSLVRAMQAQGARGYRGVTVCLIRDPEEALNSFFVLAVVNGESLSILTDRSRQAHPLSRRMWHRPDRAFMKRAERLWFPYELVDIAVSADQKHLFAKAREALVPINAQAVELADFSKLDPPSAIWLTLVFELLRQEYLEENRKLPQLSYTTEMIRKPMLLAVSKTDIVVDGHWRYQPLIAKPFKREDVTAETTHEQWQHQPCGHNEWMIGRYGEQVPEEALNVVGPEELRAIALLPDVAIVAGEVDTFFDRRDRTERAIENLQAMDPLGFGTKDQVEADRLWTARYNQCKIVQARAEEDFKRTKDEVTAWIRARVEARRQWFIEHAVRGELRTQALVAHRAFGPSFEGEDRRNGGKVEEVNVLDVIVGEKWWRYSDFARWVHAFSLSQWDREKQCFICPVTGGLTTRYHATFAPLDAQSLAFLLDCQMEQLPWQLQHWYYRDEPQYTGNPILDRIDPSDWVLSNPWSAHNGFGIKIAVSLSKRVVNRMRKELALEPIDWTAREAEDQTKD
jgi:hypothetical protein